MSWRCVTCDQVFDSIPDGAVQITPGDRRVNSYRLADGTIHSLRKTRPMSEEDKHSRRRHNPLVVGCEFCFPPPKPEQPEPVEQPVVQPQVLEPIVEEVVTVPE